LFEESFDLGLTDYLSMRERQKQLQEDMKTWEEQEQERADEAEAAGEQYIP
jgi:hypothetical protein